MPEKDEYTGVVESLDIKWNIGNCKRCILRFSCGNKNKKEADWCERYRPEIKRKRSKKR